MDPEDDFDLLRAWKDGDAAAGNRLFRRHFSPVYGFFWRKLGQGGADELTQRTFLGCVESLDAYRGEASFRGYLFGIARKQLLRHFAEKVRVEQRLDFAEVSLDDLGPTPSQAVADVQQLRLLARALRRIPVDLQLAVELHYVHELPIADVAIALEIPPGTVKSRLSRARTRIREVVQTLAEDPSTASSTIDALEDWARRLADPPVEL